MTKTSEENFNRKWEVIDEFYRSGAINIVEFTELCRALFIDPYGVPHRWFEGIHSVTCLSFIHSLDSSVVTELFYIFNVSGDGSISKEEFSFCYEQWIKKETIDIQKILGKVYLSIIQIVQPKSALVVVDIQNDFISGSLSSPSAVEVSYPHRQDPPKHLDPPGDRPHQHDGGQRPLHPALVQPGLAPARPYLLHREHHTQAPSLREQGCQSIVNQLSNTNPYKLQKSYN